METEVIFKSKTGICFEKRDFKTKSEVKVVNYYNGKRYVLARYSFKKIDNPFTSPFLSWKNLNCCDGWACDKDRDYLLTAVQSGQKLVSDIVNIDRKKLDPVEIPLHCGVYEYNSWRHIFSVTIYRKGALNDYFDIQEIIDAYKAYGVELDQQERNTLFFYGSQDIFTFVKSDPYDLYNPRRIAEYITTGLLLGYPIESTVSILQGTMK